MTPPSGRGSHLRRLGGRSVRYEERRAQRGVEQIRAPGWSDAAACMVMQSIQAAHRAAGGATLYSVVADILLSSSRLRSFLQALRLGTGDRGVAEEVLKYYAVRMRAAGSRKAQRDKVARALMNPLRRRHAAAGGADMQPTIQLTVPRRGGPTFHQWLSVQPRLDRRRDISDCTRILRGLSRWPLGWLDDLGVVCYERAHGRVTEEGRGRVSERLARGLVHRHHMPTAVANRADHYVLLSPINPPRFLTVAEVSRSFGLSCQSPLYHTLCATETLTPTQAVTCLGRAVHVGVAIALLDPWVGSVLPKRGLRYASLYSGIDTFAAAVDELAQDWEYVFACEKDDACRRTLHEAWGARGLSDRSIYYDAESDEVCRAAPVDLLSVTPDCEEFSPRNHSRSYADQQEALRGLWRGLGYVRLAQPKVVIVENVADVSAVEAITGVLRRLPGYAVARRVVDPYADLMIPVSRTRCYWVLAPSDADS